MSPAARFPDRHRRTLRLLAWSLALWAQDVLAKAPYPFSVDIERIGQEHRLVGRNRGPAPVSVKLTLPRMENVASDQSWPLYAVVRPYSEVLLARLYAAVPDRTYRFTNQVAFQVGNYFAVHNALATYRLPFDNGRSFVIAQAHGGPVITHNSPDNQHAVDISMPEGTPILAAREGTVIEVEGGQRVGAKDTALLKMANFIRILHDDETTAVYAHLAPNGVLVQVGQKVQAGTLIGLSGSTGYSSGPHLHFAVQQIIRSGENFQQLSVPFRFSVGTPPYVFSPQNYQKLTADYLNPGQPPLIISTPIEE